MERTHEKYDRLIARCKDLTPVPTAVAHPCDESSLEGAVEAAEMGILQPILVGPRVRIEAVAAQFQLDLSGYEIVDAPHSHASAKMAVELAREGKAEMLMKGSLHTDELMGAVVKSATGLRTERRISHAFIMDVPSLDRAIIVTDAAINIFPTLEDKMHITQNAIDLSTALGFPQPKVAILSAMETVNPHVPSTVEAAALCKMADRNQIPAGRCRPPRGAASGQRRQHVRHPGGRQRGQYHGVYRHGRSADGYPLRQPGPGRRALSDG